MNDSNDLRADQDSASGSPPVVLLDVFYASPNTELCNASLAAPRRATVARRLSIAYRDDPAQRAQLRTDTQYLQSLDHLAVSAADSLLDTGTELIVTLAPAGYVSVQHLLDLVRRAETRLPLEIALQIVHQLLDAVSFIHEITVKDKIPSIDVPLQPEALLIDEQGRVSIPAIRLSPPPYITSSILDAANRRYFVYAAPEQCVAGHTPDTRACFYTLGMLCYELLTSKPLFSPITMKDPEGIVRRKLRLLHPLASDVHLELKPTDDLIMALLEPVPGDRQADPEEIRRGIASVTSAAGLSRPDEIVSCIADLERALRDEAGNTGETDMTARLSSVTEIAQYNAS